MHGSLYLAMKVFPLKGGDAVNLGSANLTSNLSKLVVLMVFIDPFQFCPCFVILEHKSITFVILLL